MNILRITTLWTPFEFWASRKDPECWYDLIGPTGTWYVLIGASSENRDLTGPSQEPFAISGISAKSY